MPSLYRFLTDPITHEPPQTTQHNYSNIMAETTARSGKDPRVVDIAMLGAHDAFTSGITKASRPNPQEIPRAAHPFLRPVKGMVARISRAQRSSACDLARRGVRYFDARAAWADGDFYACHGLLGGKLEDDIRGLARFLGETEGEVVVFDLQHAFLKGSGTDALFAWLERLGLFGFVRFDPTKIPLGELTYGQATRGGSGVVLLANRETYQGCKHYDRAGAIRSNWHDTDSIDTLFERMHEEHTNLHDNRDAPDWNGFRVNQAVTTPQLPKGFKRLMTGWSLLDAGSRVNARLIRQEGLTRWLGTMPIVMVDCADSMENGFNDEIMRIIGEYNGRA